MDEDEARAVEAHIDTEPGRADEGTPHTAFRDPSYPDAKPRSSIEFRTVAFFE